jgi:hypothetical protein
MCTDAILTIHHYSRRKRRRKKRKKPLTPKKNQTTTAMKTWKKKVWTGMIWSAKQLQMTEDAREMTMPRSRVQNEREAVVKRFCVHLSLQDCYCLDK